MGDAVEAVEGVKDLGRRPGAVDDRAVEMVELEGEQGQVSTLLPYSPYSLTPLLPYSLATLLPCYLTTLLPYYYLTTLQLPYYLTTTLVPPYLRGEQGQVRQQPGLRVRVAQRGGERRQLQGEDLVRGRGRVRVRGRGRVRARARARVRVRVSASVRVR